MKLQKGNYILPFWGSPDYLTRGRDPLGLQTASLATYARLIPIITNLTARIRYFGLYCWLLEKYAQVVQSTNPADQKRFIRRAELLIAFMMVKWESQITGIPGHRYAENHLDTDLLDIKEGADKEPGKQGTYWQLSWGAFGQYYASAMQLSGLITHSKNAPEIYIVTEKRGRPLATAFEKNLTTESKDLFLDAITKGEIIINNLDVLVKSYSITDIPPGTEEHRYYLNLLLSADIPLVEEIQHADEGSNYTQTFSRKTTMEIILRYIRDHDEKWDNFKHLIYKQKGDFPEVQNQEVSYGWYFYQMNEYWHYAIETLFWSMLYLMDSLPEQYNNLPVGVLIDTLAEQFYSEIIKINGIGSSKNQSIWEVVKSNKDEKHLVESIAKEVSQRKPIQAALTGLKLIVMVWDRNKGELNKIDQYVQKYNISRPGDVLEGLKWFDKNKKLNAKMFIRNTIQRYLINRHLHVAFNKMGAGSKNTLKFNIEHNLVSHLETVEPAFTTPRIYSLYQIMVDLGLIDKDGNITEAGRNLLA